MNEYKTRVKYKQGEDLAFADFTIRYTGQSRVIPAQYPRGFTYFHFEVKAGGRLQKIRWSSGTGMIAPLDFSVGDKPFWLEMQASDALGHLEANELVISPREVP